MAVGRMGDVDVLERRVRPVDVGMRVPTTDGVRVRDEWMTEGG
jgi:hypothetical protein